MQFTVPQPVSEILQKVSLGGHEIYIVGGAVRDLLMERKVTDWDFTSATKPEELLKIFPQAFYDNKFGTVGIVFIGFDKPFEITTFRTEQDYTDNRRPANVAWGKTLEEDLIRRDFTINAMALKLKQNSKNHFELIDPHGGQKDLENRIIRAVGNPQERFSEDALRMLRAIRIAAELGFIIELQTFEAIAKNSALIKNISWERIRDELFKILKTDYVFDGLMLLRNTGLLELIIPEVNAGFGVQQASPGRHHIYDVGTHSFLATRFCPSPDPLVRLATLLHDVGKPVTQKTLPNGTITFYNHEVAGAQIAYQIGTRLRLSKDELKKLVTLVRWHQFSVDERQTDSAIRRFMRRVGKENIQDMLALRTGDRLGGGARETSWRLEKYKDRIEHLSVTPFAVSDMVVDGNDVMKVLGVKPGPIVGQILNKLFAEVLEDAKKNDRDYLLQKIRDSNPSS